MSNSYDEDAILGAKIERLVVSILQKHVDGGLVSAAAMNDLKARLSALEEVSSNENIGERTADAFDSQLLKVGGVDVTDATNHTVTFSQASSKSDITSGSTLSNLFGKIKKWYNSFGSLAWKSSVSDADISGTISDSHIESASAWNGKAEQVNVTNYTSFSDIGAVISAGNIPYYYHQVGIGAAKLYYQGTSVSNGVPPTVSQVFAGVFNGVLYETRFVNGASAFSSVTETPIFSAERVVSSGESSSWSMDDQNVPTRAAVEAKIASAISGDIGGLLGGVSVSQINYYIMMGFNFKKGDWFVSSDSGTVYYFPNNDRSQTQQSVDVLENQEVYWTTDGRLVARPDLSMNIFRVSNLEDWNTLNATGVYAIESQASNVLNGPGEGSYGRIVCYVAVTNGRIVQLAVGARVWRRQSSNDGGFSNSSWEQLAFASQIDTYVAKTGVYNASTNPFALKDYVDALSTNIPKSRLDQNVQNSLTRADNALTGDPLGITNGSGVTSAYRGAIVFILFANSDFVVHGSGGPVISGATVGGKLCVNPKWLVEYKINAGDRKNHQMYAVLNASGSDFVLTKGVDSSSASAADHVLVKNEKIEFFGCYGGSSTLQNSDYYLINY